MGSEVRRRLPDGKLGDAITYAVSSKGKRVRSLMCYAAADCLGLPCDLADPPGIAVELVHTYSLIHDDLPAMDDDDLRRGQPSLHKAFDEAIAILTGDALLTCAFEILASAPGDPALKMAWVRLLARAAGAQGMIKGQVLDLEGEGRSLELGELTEMHRNKSGRMISVGLAMMAAAVPDLDDKVRRNLLAFGDHIGLAFQIRDDILDEQACTRVLGKPQGSDAAKGKSTFAGLLGIAGAKEQMRLSLSAAEASLERIALDTAALGWVARYITERDF